jgi:predicted dehydrogenase
MERIEQFQSLVEQNNLKVLVGYQYRFHPGLQEIARSLSGGAIGRVLSVGAHWGEYLPDWHPWEDYRTGYSARRELGGGVLLTLSHPMDYLGWLLGEIEAVWALVGSLGDLDLEVEDTAVVGLRFKNGALGSLYLDYNQRPTSHRLEIIGTTGTIRWDYSKGGVEISGKNPGQQRAGENDSSRAAPTHFQSGEPRKFSRNEMFLAEMRHFLSVLHGLEKPVCTLENGIEAMRLALYALHSARSGQLVSL